MARDKRDVVATGRGPHDSWYKALQVDLCNRCGGRDTKLMRNDYFMITSSLRVIKITEKLVVKVLRRILAESRPD